MAKGTEGATKRTRGPRGPKGEVLGELKLSGGGTISTILTRASAASLTTADFEAIQKIRVALNGGDRFVIRAAEQDLSENDDLVHP